LIRGGRGDGGRILDLDRDLIPRPRPSSIAYLWFLDDSRSSVSIRFFSSFRARFSSFRSALRRRFCSLSIVRASVALVVAVGEVSVGGCVMDVGLVVVVVPGAGFLAGSKPLRYG
jgi:hypothetical protein